MDGNYLLTVSSGPAKGQSWHLSDRAIEIGRSLDCTVRIADPLISRVQCRIELRDGRPYFREVSQSNPTLVNGEPMHEGYLEPGDEVLMGSTVVVLSGRPAEADLHYMSAPLDVLESREKTESIYLAARFDSPVHAAGRVSVRKLTRLVARTRDFAACGTEAELVARALDDLSEELSPEYIGYWDVSAEVPTGILVLEERGLLSGVIREQVADGLRSNGATAGRILSGPDATTIMTVPVNAMGLPMGCVVAQAAPGAGWHTRDSLDYAVALADLLAPYFGTLSNVQRITRENTVLRRPDSVDANFVGKSEEIARLINTVERVSVTDLNVLVLGETGTGKELIARLLHDCSPRAKGPFIAFNCAAFPDDLIESEVFGHERGAFTGAVSMKRGLVELADGGTLALDELGELSTVNQAKLLRVLETRTFRRVGGTKELRSDFRLVAMTSADLPRQIGEGTFRADLYHRLNAVELTVPPLRERRDDIVPLAEYFLSKSRKFARHPVLGINAGGIRVLRSHDWPGNVRELRNVIERAVALCSGPYISSDDITFSDVRWSGSTAQSGGNRGSMPLKELERMHILRTLEVCGGDVEAASRQLGLGRSTLYSKLKEYKAGNSTDVGPIQ